MSAVEDDSLPALLATAATRHPDRTALLCGTARVTFAELRQRSRSLARGFAELGVEPGDRVAIWLPNVPLWCEAFLACAELGAIAVGINTRFRSAELADVLGRTEAKLLVFSPRLGRINFLGILQDTDCAALSSLTAIVADDEESLVSESVCGKPVVRARRLLERPQHDSTLVNPEAGCVLFTTSGTTSRPKFVLHTQRSIVRHARDTAKAFGYDMPDARLMAVTPFSGVAGFGLPIAALAARAPLVFAPMFDTEASLEEIREHGVTHVHANHEIARRWLEAARGPEAFSTLKLVNCGSRIATLVSAAKALSVPLLSIYGSSELQARFSRQRPELAPERALEAGGFPIAAEAHVRTSDPETGRVLDIGKQGELEVKAPSAMSEYFGDAPATAKAMTTDGYVRTGDFGWTREDGSFVLEGRMGDVLKLSGFMTSPAEIETMISAHPAVAGCQVVGVATDRGDRAAAFVCIAEGAAFDEAALIAYCRKSIAAYKVPVRIFAIDEFPMTEGSNAPKVRKTELKRIAETQIEAGAK
jgi:fatty-acyl-CoA synthase